MSISSCAELTQYWMDLDSCSKGGLDYYPSILKKLSHVDYPANLYRPYSNVCRQLSLLADLSVLRWRH